MPTHRARNERIKFVILSPPFRCHSREGETAGCLSTKKFFLGGLHFQTEIPIDYWTFKKTSAEKNMRIVLLLKGEYRMWFEVGHVYSFISQPSGKYLNREGSGALTSRANATVYQSTGNPDQRWKIIQDWADYRIVSMLSYPPVSWFSLCYQYTSPKKFTPLFSLTEALHCCKENLTKSSEFPIKQ